MSWSKQKSPVKISTKALFAFKKAVRNIVAGCNLQPGSRISVFGEIPEEIEKYLIFLGIDVVQEDAMTANNNVVSKNQNPSFDAIGKNNDDAVLNFLPASGSYSLNSNSFLMTTAMQLDGVRPGGYFAFVTRAENEKGISHTQECYVRHLCCFPGKIAHNRTGEGWFSSFKSQESQHELIALKVPGESAYPRDWTKFVRPAVAILPESCCECADTTKPLDRPWKKAA